MARYTYRIDRHFSDTEGWGIENDDARGTEDYTGPAKEYAKEIAQNQYADLLSLGQTGEWRVLVWDGDTEGDEDDVDVVHLLTVTEEDLKPRGGRPKIGNIVSVAMGDTLPRVDAYAEENGIKRAEAIRKLVTIGLDLNEDDFAASIYEGDGGVYWVGIAAYEPQGYTVAADSDEEAYWPTKDLEGQSWPTSVPTSRDHSEAAEEAGRILAKHGWDTTEEWRSEEDALYADVTRA
ncbi:hypothetical protein [Nocardiopsis synnemataformans]|uniref:hypothetical protein n=1 Tax=Nocardiopsis synnemataformans TaxID=61305 RepID=UPI003EB8D712